MPDKKITLIVEQLASVLIKNDKRLAVAESCTGGWVAKVLTDLGGSSAWFERGFVTYSNQSKHEMLGVAEVTLERFGAVSKETVTEMALGALKHSHADLSLSISGIAGPGGATEDKPQGLVWFSWAVNFNHMHTVLASEKQVFKGDRDAVRKKAVVYALKNLIILAENYFSK